MALCPRKIQKDGAHAVLMVPKWTRQTLQPLIKEMAVMSMTVPEETKLFGRLHKKCRETMWPVEIFLVCGHKERCDYLTGFHRHMTTPEPNSQVKFGLVTHVPPGSPPHKGMRTREGHNKFHECKERIHPQQQNPKCWICSVK